MEDQGRQKAQGRAAGLDGVDQDPLGRLVGEGLDRLIVTTAREDLAPPTDDDGRTFVIDAPGAVGRAEPRVVL